MCYDPLRFSLSFSDLFPHHFNSKSMPEFQQPPSCTWRKSSPLGLYVRTACRLGGGYGIGSVRGAVWSKAILLPLNEPKAHSMAAILPLPTRPSELTQFHTDPLIVLVRISTRKKPTHAGIPAAPLLPFCFFPYALTSKL